MRVTQRRPYGFLDGSSIVPTTPNDVHAPMEPSVAPCHSLPSDNLPDSYPNGAGHFGAPAKTIGRPSQMSADPENRKAGRGGYASAGFGRNS